MENFQLNKSIQLISNNYFKIIIQFSLKKKNMNI